MTYTARTRDRYRLAVAAVTGVTAVGALTSTGWFAGVAAREHTADQTAQQAQQQAAADRAARAQARYETRVARQQSAALGSDVALRQRPAVTRVTTRYVASTAQGAVGSGGSVSQAAPAQPAPAGNPAPAHVPAPPPPPPPPPAPSSGS
jgi:hypothetical protein